MLLVRRLAVLLVLVVAVRAAEQFRSMAMSDWLEVLGVIAFASLAFVPVPRSPEEGRAPTAPDDGGQAGSRGDAGSR